MKSEHWSSIKLTKKYKSVWPSVYRWLSTVRAQAAQRIPNSLHCYHNVSTTNAKKHEACGWIFLAFQLLDNAAMGEVALHFSDSKCLRRCKTRKTTTAKFDSSTVKFDSSIEGRLQFRDVPIVHTTKIASWTTQVVSRDKYRTLSLATVISGLVAPKIWR